MHNVGETSHSNCEPFKKRMFLRLEVGRADFNIVCTGQRKRQNLETGRLGVKPARYAEKSRASHASRTAGKAGQEEAPLDVVSASLRPLIAQSCLCLFLAELANRPGAYCTDKSKHAQQLLHIRTKHVQVSWVTHLGFQRKTSPFSRAERVWLL